MADGPLAGKVAIVTGAGSTIGIGRRHVVGPRGSRGARHDDGHQQGDAGGERERRP